MPERVKSTKSPWSHSELEALCHRFGLSLQSGLSITETCAAEAQAARGRKREILRRASKSVQEGRALADAIEGAGSFPPLLVEMTRVGEETGNLGEVFLKLSNHYRDLVRTRRIFYQGITWPLLQLVAGVLVITLFLLALDYLQTRVPNLVPYDLFQLGLSPLQNLLLFWSVIVVLAAMLLALTLFVRRGWMKSLWGRAISWVPLVGKTWERMATSRFAWSFGTAIDAGVDAVKAIRLGLRASHHPRFQAHENEIVQSIERGNPFEASLRQAGVFPDDFLQAIAVGERTGRVSESIQRLSEDYEERSTLSLRRLGYVSGLVVSIAVFALLGLSVLTMYTGYMQNVSEALNANTSTLAEIRGEIPSGEEPVAPSDNEIIQTRDKMVKDFVENNESFKQIESIYTQLGRFGEVSNDEFLDGLLGESPVVERLDEARREMEREREQREQQSEE